MENRLEKAYEYINNLGNIFLHLDYNADYYGRILLNKIFGPENFSNEIKWYYTNKIPDTRKKSFTNSFDVIFAYAKNYDRKVFNWLFEKRENPIKVSLMKKENGKKIYLKGDDGKGLYKLRDERTMDNIWKIALLHAQPEIVNFRTQKPEELLSRIILSSSLKNDLIFDFFSGSGTTIAVAHKLNRKWLGVEMGNYFDNVILSRMKEVLSGNSNHEPCGISKDINWQGGGFFKYYELEQYEDVLKRANYNPTEKELQKIDFDFSALENGAKAERKKQIEDSFSLSEKMADKGLEIDLKKEQARFVFEKLYPDVDIPETISNLFGKKIKKISKDKVVFEDDAEIDLNNLDFEKYEPLKKLIYW